MYFIENHKVWGPGFPKAIASMAEDRAEAIALVEEHPGHLGSRPRGLFNDAQIAIAVDPVARYTETWYAWAAAMQMYNAIFAVAGIPESQMVGFRIDLKDRFLKGVGENSRNTTPGNWDVAFMLAIACRSKKHWTDLANFQIDVLRNTAEREKVTYNEYTYHWIAALQAFMKNDRETLFRELEKAIVLSGPEYVTFGREETDMLVFPVMNTFRCLAQFDAPGFNKALAQGLELHKSYYTADEDRSKKLAGIVPSGLLAMACIAYERNRSHKDFPLEVESGYLPHCILNAAWHGEFEL